MVLKKTSKVEITIPSKKKRRALFVSVNSPCTREFFCRFFNAINSVYDRGERLYICSVLCLVNLLARTIVENICLPLFYIFTSI